MRYDLIAAIVAPREINVFERGEKLLQNGILNIAFR